MAKKTAEELSLRRAAERDKVAALVVNRADGKVLKEYKKKSPASRFINVSPKKNELMLVIFEETTGQTIGEDAPKPPKKKKALRQSYVYNPWRPATPTSTNTSSPTNVPAPRARPVDPDFVGCVFSGIVALVSFSAILAIAYYSVR
jgi:hypothetical protein